MKKVIVVQYYDNKLRVKVVDAPHNRDLLQFMYEEIGCNLVQVVYCDGFECWVDEEGTFSSGSPVHKYDFFPEPLTGNIVFTKGIDNEGETTFLDDQEDQDLILKIMGMVSDARFIGTTE